MKNGMNVFKGVIAGMAVGGALSAIAVTTIKPSKKKSIKRKASNTLDTIGSIMQNIADYTR